MRCRLAIAGFTLVLLGTIASAHAGEVKGFLPKVRQLFRLRSAKLPGFSAKFQAARRWVARHARAATVHRASPSFLSPHFGGGNVEVIAHRTEQKRSLSVTRGVTAIHSPQGQPLKLEAYRVHRYPDGSYRQLTEKRHTIRGGYIQIRDYGRGDSKKVSSSGSSFRELDPNGKVIRDLTWAQANKLMAERNPTPRSR